MGIDHEKLSSCFNGRGFLLKDVAGEMLKEILP
jgi:hypothetical protein